MRLEIISPNFIVATMEEHRWLVISISLVSFLWSFWDPLFAMKRHRLARGKKLKNEGNALRIVSWIR